LDIIGYMPTIFAKTLFFRMICFVDGSYSSIHCIVMVTSIVITLIIYVCNLQVSNVKSNVP
jgi:hypothetical protein